MKMEKYPTWNISPSILPERVYGYPLPLITAFLLIPALL
jgi:hypothetical protein